MKHIVSKGAGVSYSGPFIGGGGGVSRLDVFFRRKQG